MPGSPTSTPSAVPTSTTSGNNCTFFGGMQAAAGGCVSAALGRIASGPAAMGERCITGAFQASAVHTAGCMSLPDVPSGTYPTPRPN